MAVFDTRTTGALTVKIFDRSGKLVVSSKPFVDWWGIAWTPTNELWFAAIETGRVETAVFGLDLDGRQRVVFRAPGGVTLHDISAQVDVLASFDHGLSRVELIDDTDLAPQDRTWRDGGGLAGFSAAHVLLLSESSGTGSGGPRGSVYFWQPGDRQPVRICAGARGIRSRRAG